LGYKESFAMATDTTVRARIDDRVKKEAAHVLEDMGLSVSDAIRMMLMRVAAEKALPFEVKVPNAVTARTLRKADRGEDLVRSKNAADLRRRPSGPCSEAVRCDTTRRPPIHT
jgi:DNA-damage-inducible protein J